MTASAEFRPYGGREIYNQTPEDKLEECHILADALDELIATPVNIDSDIQSTACVDEQGTYINRSFRYIDGDHRLGWAWPLTEKSIEVSYQRSAGPLTAETYLIRLDTIIHQTGIDSGSIPNIYTIRFYGSDRSSAVATVEAPNLTDIDQGDFVTRETTPYDHQQLFEELCAFDKLLCAEQRENDNIARMN